ncbi:hypothetical protein B0H34DRAFT_709520 [Crassisporium funariophilum]|nr:hypothetical protein B0H34DRAFT_709520 [Crassisporium funariophilum]
MVVGSREAGMGGGGISVLALVLALMGCAFDIGCGRCPGSGCCLPLKPDTQPQRLAMLQWSGPSEAGRLTVPMGRARAVMTAEVAVTAQTIGRAVGTKDCQQPIMTAAVAVMIACWLSGERVD